MNKGDGYVQTKIKFCQASPFTGLGALGMWYGYCLESEIASWQSASHTAKLGSAADKAAFCEHPAGYNIRRVLSDGKLLKVYDSKGHLEEDTLMPVALSGKNLTLLDLPDVVPFLKAKGAIYCRFAINGLPYTGYVLDGKAFSAAWSDTGIGIFFETSRGKNPNGKIIEPLFENVDWTSKRTENSAERADLVWTSPQQR